MTLLDRGTCNPSTFAAPPAPVVLDVNLPSAVPAATPTGDEPLDAPEMSAILPFSNARRITRSELDQLLADADRPTPSIVHELGDRLGVPGWDGVQDVSFSRGPWFSPTGIGPATLHVPGPAPEPGRPGSVFEAFWRAVAALRRERGTFTRQDEREIIVRLLLSLSTLREEHA